MSKLLTGTEEIMARLLSQGQEAESYSKLFHSNAVILADLVKAAATKSSTDSRA